MHRHSIIEDTQGYITQIVAWNVHDIVRFYML